MASTSDKLYVTYIDLDRDLLKVWGQRNRIGGTYIERLLLQLLPEFNSTVGPNPSRIHKGMFCFAKYTDDNYYRARVISRVQGDSVCVLFVDYGNRDTIKISDIRVQDGKESDVLVKMSEQAEDYYLARVAAPPSGWTRDILSEIRRDICYDEFHYKVVDQIGDQKILDVQFRNEDFSNYLVKKQLARPLPLPVQREMILSYCSLVSNDVRRDDTFKDTPPRVPFSTSLPPPGLKVPPKPLNITSDVNMQLNFVKPNVPINYSCPPPPVQYSHPRQARAPFQQAEANIPKNSFYHQGGHINNQIPIAPVPVQPVNPNLNPLLSQQLSQFYQIQESMDSCINNNNNINNNHSSNAIIELLAQQVKQYIAKDNAKTETEPEETPHHYVNSVLEVGNTYNVLISHIDDGPWSFSIQLLSSEIELQKLMDELSSVELVPIKPPIILGSPCIGSSVLYGNLCRGVVVSISRSAVKVYFVDFGNTEDLPASSIYELPPKFFKIRVLSQKFCLSGLQKVAYSDDIKKFFKEVVQDGLLILRVTSLETDNLPTCELYLKERNIKRILNEKMQKLRSSGLEDFPKVGDTETVLVTWVVSPQKFFVQLSKRDLDLSALKKELEEVETKGQPLTYQQLSVGFKCICQYASDGHWYRAVITSVDSEEAISVFYIDYGNTETVSISCLRKVDGSGLINQMCNQALQCCLKGYENHPSDEELTKMFESLTLEKELQMTVTSSEKQLLSVKLHENGNDIALRLTIMKTEEAKKKKEMESISYSPGSAWDSSESGIVISRNKSEKDNRSQMEESFEQNDRNFSGDPNRKKNKRGRPFNNFESLQSPSWATHSRLKSRFEERRDNRSTFQERDDQQRGWRNREPKEFGNWDPINIAPSRGPIRGRDESYNNGRASRGREFSQTRNRTGRDDRRSNGYGEKKFGDDREGRRFGNNRGLDSFGSGEDRKKFNDRGNNFDEKKSTRVPVKREDIAPPGSKFEEKVVEVGSCERGIVTYYFSPDEFFVQLLAQEGEFKKMMKDIQHYYSDKYSIRDPVKAGDIVIAQFSHDKILYRAEVIKPSPVTVRYIDYGNQEPVQPKGTWFVAKQFLELPQQVIKCRLSGLQPLGSDWPPPGSGVDKFFEFEEYKCIFLRKEGDTYEISMEATENGKDVASEIIAAGLARPLDPELDVPETDYSILPNQILRLFVCHVDSPSQFYVVINPKASELIAEAISALIDSKRSLPPIDWSKLEPEMPCLATADGASWYRGNIMKFNGNSAVVWLCDRGDSVDIPKEKIMNIPDYLKAFQPQAVQCCLQGVSHVEDEVNFRKRLEGRSHLVHILSADDKRLFVILYDEEGNLYDFEDDCDVAKTIEPIGQLPLLSQSLPLMVSHLESVNEVYIQRSIDEGDLLNFLEQINQFYAGEGEDWPEGEDIPQNTLVAAKSITYDSWYRGRVKSSPEGQWEVIYIDYGNSEILPRENLKKLDSSFRGMNAFCKAVALDGRFDEATAKEAQTRFWDVCADKELVGNLRNEGGELLVELKVNGESLTDLLKLVASNTADECVEVRTNLPDKVENECKSATEAKSGVFVSHVDSPNRFWIHKEAIVDELEHFQRRLEISCEERPDKTEANVGDLVAATFSNMWYRARVIEADDEFLKVQFIDYGNTAIVDLSSGMVKELAEELVDVPAFAMRFTLKGFWSEKARSKFMEIILRNEEDPLSVTVLEEGDPTVVDLFQNGRSVTHMLEEEVGSEVEYDIDLPIVYITHIVSPLDFYVQRESSTDILKELLDRLSDAPNFGNPSSVEKDELYAAKYSEDEAWYRARVVDISGEEIAVRFVDYGNISVVSEVKCLPRDLVDIPILSENCSLVYGKNCDSWSDAACEMFAEYADGRPLRMKTILNRGERAIVRLFHEYRSVSEELEPLCKKDGRKEMYVSHAVSPTHFYIQYVDDEQYKQVVEALRDGGSRSELEGREKGAICQVCLPEDGCWYRGKVLRDLGEEGCEVRLIDSGFVCVAKELRKLPAEIRSIPPRALKCSLDLDAEVTKTAKEEFVNLTAAGAAVFRGRIISPGNTNIVSLKLDGRIIEETLELVPEKSLTNGHENSPEETEPGKEIPEEPEQVPHSVDSVSAFSQSNSRNKVHKIVPGCISRGEEETTPKEETPKVLLRKLKFSEKVVPGSISRGVSLDSVAEEQEEGGVPEDKQLTKSAPATPRPLRKSEYVKTDVDDRLVPGCISTGIPLCCSPMSEKKAQSEKIVPGAVNGNY